MELTDEMQSEQLYDRLMERPDADRIVARAGAQLKREAAARAEFRAWLTPSVKAEFINGEVVLHSPAKRGHLEATGNLFYILLTYVGNRQLGAVSVEKALVELGRNDFEPDLCYWKNELTEGWTKEIMVHPPPSLAVEILSKSTEARDRGIKFDAYLTYGVEEYWIVDPVKQIIEQYVRSVGTDDVSDYQLIGKFHGEHLICPEVLPGLSFPAAAIFSQDRSLEVAQQLLLSTGGGKAGASKSP